MHFGYRFAHIKKSHWTCDSGNETLNTLQLLRLLCASASLSTSKNENKRKYFKMQISKIIEQRALVFERARNCVHLGDIFAIRFEYNLHQSIELLITS